jgi:hypothetical protein
MTNVYKSQGITDRSTGRNGQLVQLPALNNKGPGCFSAFSSVESEGFSGLLSLGDEI